MVDIVGLKITFGIGGKLAIQVDSKRREELW